MAKKKIKKKTTPRKKAAKGITRKPVSKKTARKKAPAKKPAKPKSKKASVKKKVSSTPKKSAKRTVKKSSASKSKPKKKAKTSGANKKITKKKTPVKKTRAKSPSKSKVPAKKRKPRKPRGVRPLIKIRVVGVGGGGGNAITRMRKNFSVRGVEFIAINTDLQDLESCDAHRKLHIGKNVTKGMGAGMNPDLGQQSAEENREEIAEALKDTDMVFITSGFGGGTGTGAAPVVAEVAKELGILTVAVVTKPFSFEGSNRMKIAEDGVSRIKDKVDTLLVIPNDRIFSIIDKNTSVLKAFEKIDDILRSAVQGVAEIISSSGLVNVDFADIRSVAEGAGMAVIGVGSAGGADRATKAMNQAMNSPLLEISIDGARSVLFGVAGGRDLKMSEINEAAKIIMDNVDPSARIIFGAYHDRRLRSGHVKITLIATGFNGMLFKSEPDSMTLFSDDTELMQDGGEEVDSDKIPEGKEENSKKETTKEPEKDEDTLDIPTFLRRRGRKK